MTECQDVVDNLLYN